MVFPHPLEDGGVARHPPVPSHAYPLSHLVSCEYVSTLEFNECSNSLHDLLCMCHVQSPFHVACHHCEGSPLDRTGPHDASPRALDAGSSARGGGLRLVQRHQFNSYGPEGDNDARRCLRHELSLLSRDGLSVNSSIAYGIYLTDNEY